MPMAAVSNIHMYYESCGEGEPLLLISGNGADSSQWKAQIPVFSKKYRVIAFDNRDAGRTDRTDMPYTIETMADDAMGLMDVLGIENAHILGTSMGGMIAQNIAYKYPERVMGLVLAVTMMKVSPRANYACNQAIKQVLDGSDPEALAKYSVAWSFSDELFENPAVVEIVKNAMLAVLNQRTVDAFKRQNDATCVFDSRAWVGKIVAPTLVMGAEDDINIPRKYSSRDLAKSITGSKFVLLPGGHASFLGRPDAFQKYVTEFLSSID